MKILKIEVTDCLYSQIIQHDIDYNYVATDSFIVAIESKKKKK